MRLLSVLAFKETNSELYSLCEVRSSFSKGQPKLLILFVTVISFQQSTLKTL